jgi:DNA-binding PadR family transcriptional regulator
MSNQSIDRDLKKGSAELLILSLLERRQRHGYEICKLIETRSKGKVRFRVASLYPLLYRLEDRGLIQGKWVEKPGQRRRRFYKVTAAGTQDAGRASRGLGGVRGGHPSHYWDRVCLIGMLQSGRA